MAEERGVLMTEKESMRGLAIRHYSGKWKQAQRLASDSRHHPELDHWSRVRVLYLELGGLYIQQLRLLQRLVYMLPFDTSGRA